MFRSGVGRCRPCLDSAGISSRWGWFQPLDLSARKSGSTTCALSTDSSEPEISKRRQFKEIPIDPKVMRHLDTLGMGMERKKIERGRKMRLYRRGALSSAVPGATASEDKPKTFDHPTWAVKQVSSVTTLEEIPPAVAHLPEVALVGRSNVGKSTLLNALVGLKKHPDRRASVSDTPGETRTLDFFQLGKGRRAKMVLADMPGYGFAYAHEKQRHDWKGLMMAYLRGRGAPLKRVMLLLDARHGFKKADIEFLELLYDPKGPSPFGKYHPPKIQILLTKCDLVKRIDLARRVVFVRHQLEEVSRRQTSLSVMTLSALKGAGVVELQKELAALDPKPTAAVADSSHDEDGSSSSSSSSSATTT
ncbi:unnamed protein product, partial [Scytosiphon promiscuus]